MVDIQVVGKWNKNIVGYDSIDRKIVTSDRFHDKCRRLLNLDYDINFMFGNFPGRRREVYFSMEKYGSEFEKYAKEDAVNIVFTANDGAGKVQFTPWIMLHRLSHCLTFNNSLTRRTYSSNKDVNWRLECISNEIKHNYNSSLSDKELLCAIGTMKSARQKTMFAREFQHECFAQFMWNRLELEVPEYIEVKRYGRKIRYYCKDIAETGTLIGKLENLLIEHFDYLIQSSLGKILLC